MSPWRILLRPHDSHRLLDERMDDVTDIGVYPKAVWTGNVCHRDDHTPEMRGWNDCGINRLRIISLFFHVLPSSKVALVNVWWRPLRLLLLLRVLRALEQSDCPYPIHGPSYYGGWQDHSKQALAILERPIT